MMSATVALFVFRVSISFCSIVGFLAISFSMIEIACWSVSLTSTISASDLLKFYRFFESHGLRLVNLLSKICFFDVLRASVSVEHVRQDLELTAVVQHYRNIVDFPRAKLISLCWSPSLLQDLLTFAALGFRLHLHCLLDRSERDDLLNLILDAPGSGCSVDNPDNSLTGSISLFEGLFQRPRAVRPMLDRISSCASRNWKLVFF